MLQSIRKRSGGWIVKVLIGAIAFTFVLWGTSSLWSLFIESEKVAVINDDPIYIVQYENAFLEAKRIAEQNLGALAVLSREEQRKLRQAVLEQMINDILIRQAAEEDDLGLSPAQLDSIIVNTPSFQLRGRFAERVYADFLRGSRINSQEYKEYLAGQFKYNTYLNGIRSAAFFTPSMLEEYITWKHREYMYRYAQLPAPSIDGQDAPPDEQLRAYYEDNTQRYFLPERYQIQYVSLGQEATLPLVQLQADDLDELYNERYGGLLLQANVSLYHILFNDPDQIDEGLLERAEALKGEIRSLEEFTAAAVANSEDAVTASSGGYLGNSQVGRLPIDFVDAIRDLPADQKMTKPFRSSLGVHLAWVDNITNLDIPRFDDVREDLQEELLYERVPELMLEKAEFLSDYIQTQEGLPPLSDNFPYPINQSDLLTETSPLVQEFGDTLAEELGLLEKGDISDVIWLDDGNFLAFEMLEKMPSELLTFDAAKEQVITDYLDDIARKNFVAQLSQVVEGINSGEMEAAEAQEILPRLKWQSAGPISRAQEFQSETENSILKAVSGREAPYANYTQTTEGGYVLFVVEDVINKSSEDLDKTFQLQTQLDYRNELHSAAEDWIMAHLNRKADININVVTDIGR